MIRKGKVLWEIVAMIGTDYKYPIMRLLLILLLATFNQPKIYAQQALIIDKEDISQISKKYLELSNFRKKGAGIDCVVKIRKEELPYAYSVSVTSIKCKDEIPMDSLYCFNIDSVNFYVLKNNDAIIGLVKYDIKPTFPKAEIQENEYPYVFTIIDVVVYFPIIRVFKVFEEKSCSWKKKVTFETFFPISTLSKDYWPVEKPINAITTSRLVVRDKKTAKLTDKELSAETNGKGVFRIKKH
jgi:hypothetical protein